MTQDDSAALELQRVTKERDALKRAILDGINCCDCKYDELGITIGPCELHERIARLEELARRVAQANVCHKWANIFDCDTKREPCVKCELYRELYFMTRK